MALHGELKNMPLPDILQSLKANHQSGTLRLLDGKKEFALFFDKDVVTCVHPGRPSRDYLPPIICLFLDITKETMEHEFKKKLKLSIAERLHKSRIANAAKINALHCVYSTEFLYDVFAWQSGSFRFDEGKTPEEPFDDDQRNAGLKLDIDQVLFEAMRRSDEWRVIAKHIPTMDDVFTVIEEIRPQIEQLDEPGKTIFRFCNGEHSVKEIAYHSGQDLFTTAKMIGDALETRNVRHIAPGDLIALAEKSFANDKNDEALCYFKRAIELDRGNIEVRRRFADLCLQRGMHSEATNEYKTLAHMARDKQEYDRAKYFYRQIIVANPSEYEFQKRLYTMLREINDHEARSTGLELTDTLKRLGLRNEETQILRQLIDDDANDAVCFERLGDAELSLGRDKSAIEQYFTAADLFVTQNEQQRAGKNYESILAINPDDARARKKLDELKSGLYLKKRQRRQKIIMMVEFGVVLTVIGLYLAYLAVSTIDYLGMRNRNLACLTDGDFKSIRAAAAEFRGKYRFSLINMDLRRYLAEIDRLALVSTPEIEPVVPDSLPEPVESIPENTMPPADTCVVDSVPVPAGE